MDNTHTIVILSGPKEVGKSTTAKLISKQLSGKNVVISFAGAIRAGIRAMGMHQSLPFDMDDPDTTARMKELPGQFGMSYRDLARSLGAWGRGKVQEDIWAQLLCVKIQALSTYYNHIIIDDCRIGNEAQCVLDNVRLWNDHRAIKTSAVLIELAAKGVEYVHYDDKTESGVHFDDDYEGKITKHVVDITGYGDDAMMGVIAAVDKAEVVS